MAAMASHPPEPLLLHRLPPAPHFVGRQRELEELRRLWEEGFSGVVALVGLGGAGKTAVAARFLDEILQGAALPRLEGLLVWSFYIQPDAGQFLEGASAYFGREQAPAGARGAALLQLLRESLAIGGRSLLVLDGLEKVQRQEGGAESFGQIEDPLLKGLLTRIAEGAGKTLVLVTSRFPLTDLHGFRECGYRSLDVHGLESAASVELLRHHGVHGDDTALEVLVQRFGAHALTLDHLGGLGGKFLGGDPERAPAVPAFSSAGTDRQALRLARLLQAYEQHLPPSELALLCRLCLPRRSMSLEQIMQLFLVSPPVRERTIRELYEKIPRLPAGRTSPDRDTTAVAEAIKEVLEEALCTAPIAGPEVVFSSEVLDLADTLYRFRESAAACEFAELVHLYAGSELEPPSDVLPLPAPDRQHLHFWYERYLKLRPLFVKHTSEETPQWLKSAGLKSKKSRRPAEDISPEELTWAFTQVERRLHFVTTKHFALRRLRELCRLYQRKWVLAVPLAPLDAAAVKELLDSLVARHLALREGEGLYSVHPAVRDHFSRLAPAGEQDTWHDLLREHLLSLMHRPGLRRPETPEALDLAEDALHHALEGGRNTSPCFNCCALAWLA
jgi:hypothetical protein